MVNRSLKQCTSLFKMIMTEDAPSQQRYRGFFEQPKAWLLFILHQRHQSWQARFSHYQLHMEHKDLGSKETYITLMTIPNLFNKVIIQCPHKGDLIFLPLKQVK